MRYLLYGLLIVGHVSSSFNFSAQVEEATSFKCKIKGCFGIFSSQSDLKDHRQSHYLNKQRVLKAKKPYCSKCKKSFMTRSSMLKHLRFTDRCVGRSGHTPHVDVGVEKEYTRECFERHRGKRLREKKRASLSS